MKEIVNDIQEDILSGVHRRRNNALELIYKRCYPPVKNYVFRKNGTLQDAKDVFQEGIIILYQNIKSGKFKEDATIFTYMISICYNIWKQELRKSSNNSIDLLDEQEDHSHDTAPLTFNVIYIQEVMKSLKEDCQKILIDFYYFNKSMKELSDDFNLGSEQAAKNKKSRCLKFLTKLAQEKGLSFNHFVE